MDRSLDEIVSERQVCDHGLTQATSAQQLQQVLNLTLESRPEEHVAQDAVDVVMREMPILVMELERYDAPSMSPATMESSLAAQY